MHHIQFADDDLVEAFYASELLAHLSRGRDDASILRDTLRDSSADDHLEIARACEAKATDIDAGAWGPFLVVKGRTHRDGRALHPHAARRTRADGRSGGTCDGAREGQAERAVLAA